MGSTKNLLLGWCLLLGVVLNLGCTSTEDSESSSDPVDGSAKESSSEEMSPTDAESSDDEGREAIEASLKGNSPLSSPASGQSTGTAEGAKDGIKTGLPQGDLQKFPKTSDPEELQELLLDQDQVNQESIKSCLDELSEVTKSAKNTASLKAATTTIATMIKDKLPEYHWCFLSGHHSLNQEMSGTEKSIDQKIASFQGKMTIFVALSNSLDLALGGNRYARYNRDRYIALSRDYFGRKIAPIDDPSQ